MSESDPDEADRPDALPPLRVELLPPLRDVAVPVLPLPPRERVACSSERRGASAPDQVDDEGIGVDGAAEPDMPPPLDIPPPLEVAPPPPPLDAPPPPPPSLRGTAVPVVLPFDVRS